MEFDLYSSRKKTAVGTFLVNRLNVILAGMIERLFIDRSICKFLEIGPGVGAFSDVLRHVLKEKLNYFGIEANPSLCELGRKKGYKLLNCAIPPFPDDEEWKGFDCIYLSHVLEHFPDFSIAAKAVTGMRDMLKDNGYLIIFVPDFLDWKDDFFNGDYSHSYITTERRLRELLKDMGFEIEKVAKYRACFPFPVSMLIYPLHRIIRFIAGAIYHTMTPIEGLFKMKITFARNILFVCRKPEGNVVPAR